jgi:hypothetical protein
MNGYLLLVSHTTQLHIQSQSILLMKYYSGELQTHGENYKDNPNHSIMLTT